MRPCTGLTGTQSCTRGHAHKTSEACRSLSQPVSPLEEGPRPRWPGGAATSFNLSNKMVRAGIGIKSMQARRLSS